MFGDVLSKAHEIEFFDSLSLAVLLRIVHFRCQVPSTEEGTNCGKVFPDKFCTIVSEDARRDAARISQRSRMILEMCVAIVLYDGMARVSLEYW